jgi:glycosyltransferase involved in cell wall biosynthesis
MMESSDPGGAERMLLNLIDRLDPVRWRSVVITWREGWLHEELRRRQLPVMALPLARRLDPAWIGRCRRLMREWDVRLLHAHEFAMNTYGAAVSQVTGVPLIATVHGKGYYPERVHRRIAYRFVARSAFRMVAVSRDVERFLADTLRVRAAALVTLYNGVDASALARPTGGDRVRRELGLTAGQPVVGVIGNLLPVKGHVHLVRAAARLVGAYPDVAILLSGRPIQQAELEAEARTLGVERHVRFLGFRDDVPALLDAMDVFVLPSLSEGLSLALLEAMAAAKPVVATRVGGNPELVVDGETGHLVPPRDPDALATAIARVLADRAAAARLGRQARQRVLDEFSVERMVGRYEALYVEAVGEAPGARRVARAAG